MNGPGFLNFTSINRKLLVVFLMLTILPIMVLGYFAFDSGRRSTEDMVLAHLTSVADLKKSELENWINDKIYDSKSFAENYLLKEYLTSLQDTSGTDNAILMYQVQDMLDYYQQNFDYEHVTIVDKTGKVVSSTLEDNLNMVLVDEYVTTPLSFRESYIKDIYKTSDNKFRMIFSSPIFSIDSNPDHARTVIGVLILEVDMEKTIFPIILSWPGMGETGETLLARKEGDQIVFINELRHRSGTALNLKVPMDSELAKPAIFATQGDSSIVRAKDYRGEDVLSAYRYIPIMDWGFVAKIDQAEAFASVASLMNRIFLVSSTMIVFAVSLAYVVSNRFTRQIIELEKATREVAKGNFQVIPEITSNDEIGNLANSFNEMSSQLQATLEKERALNQELAEARAREQYEVKLQALQTHALELNKAESITDISSITLDILNKMMGYEYLSFQTFNGHELITLKTYGGPISNGPVTLINRGITYESASKATTVLVNDVRTHPGYVSGFKGTLSELAVPIIIEQSVVGVINIESQELNKFNKEDVRLVEILSLHVASAIERIRSRESEKKIFEQLVEEQLKTEQAQEMDRIKTNFMSTATHEIRTPLTSIKGYSELISESLKAGKYDNLIPYFDIVERNVDRLIHLTNDLLNVQRIESGRMSLNVSQVDFNRIINQVQQEMEPILSKKGQVLKMNVPLNLDPIKVDEMRILQVIINLVCNASNYSDNDTEIFLTVENHDNMFKVSVTDAGAGIAPDDVEKLFKPFPDIEIIGKRRGTGLGLSICKGIIDLHKGKIWVESKGLNQGSTFSFTLPKTNKNQ